MTGKKVGFVAVRSCLLSWLMLMTLLLCSPAFAGHGDRSSSPKKALVLATFGTTVEQKGDHLAKVKAAMEKEHSGLPVFVAYTSNHVIRTMRKEGKEAKSVAEMLGYLGSEGYSHVAVQSLHITAGFEFDAVRETVGRFSHFPKGVKYTSCGMPLIATEDDAAELAKALAETYAPKEKDTAVIFVGHGAHGTGSLAYSALQKDLWEKHPLFFVGTIEGMVGQESIIAQLKSKKIKKVKLLPLLTVVGDHAENDIFGAEDDSWKTVLTKEGFAVESVPAGVLQHPVAVKLWTDHAKKAVKALD